MHKPTDFPVIAITSGMSGYFAVLYWWNPEDGGFPEPFETGFGRYPKTLKGELDAINEAITWSENDGVRADPDMLTRRRDLMAQIAAADRSSPFDMVAGQTDPQEDTH